MKTCHHLTNEDLNWLDDAVGYGNVSSIGAAYNRLVEFRKRIITGDGVSICSGSLNDHFDSTEIFDGWVRSRYPVFADDCLHPIFHTP